MPIPFADLKPDDEFLQALPYGVWLMDNHKWALSVWARHHTGPRRWLFHADHHWDGVDLFREDNQAQAALQAADTNTLDQWIRDENLIQYDAFIAPAVRKGLFEEIHFFCTQSDDWDKGLDPALCEAMGVVQTMHVDIDSFAHVTARAPIVFDLCLDLFNEAPKFYGSDLWSESAIESTLVAFACHIKAAEVVTVSLSFGYSGTEDDTRQLAALVVPRLIAIRASHVV